MSNYFIEDYEKIVALEKQTLCLYKETNEENILRNRNSYTDKL